MNLFTDIIFLHCNWIFSRWKNHVIIGPEISHSLIFAKYDKKG